MLICGFREFIQLILVNYVILHCSATIVHLPQGIVRGRYNHSGKYVSYLGIPYATVTDRFQEPGPPPRWDNVFLAVESPSCEQIDRSTGKPAGRRDCLVASVFTPLPAPPRPLPVLVVIPGGGFHFGLDNADTFHPKYLVNKNIIVVVINYRLGAFGFFCLQTPKAPGNLGLKDQVAAIRWVKNNIQHFGGDPTSITLFGQSAGATSIGYLLLSPETEGLFQHVILSSGSILTPYALDDDPVATASRIASRMGYRATDPDRLLEIYQNASSHDILKASHFDDTNDPMSLYVFRPCVDTSKGSLVKQSPRKIIESTPFERNVTVIIGFNDMDGIKWAERYNSQGLENLDEIFYKIIPDNLLFDTEDERSTFVAEVKDFYFKNQGLNSYEPLVRYCSDYIVMYPIVATIEYLLRTNLSMFNYYFKYDSNRNLSKRKTSLAWMKGASHTDDIFYAFDPPALRSAPVTASDPTIIDALTSFWTNVAKTGNPSNQEIHWQASERNGLNFLSIDKKIEMIPLPNRERMEFWRRIYKKYKSY